MIELLTKTMADSTLRRVYDRFGFWFVLAIAALLRLWNLGYPSKLVFDETYYVKDAWTLWNTGAERAWPADANAAFESGHVNDYLFDPSFVVHPPLGKWLIGFGMWLFGAENPFSWRIATAVLGIAAVALLMVIARRIFKSQTCAIIAGLLFAIDGHAIVLSRTALLDNILMFFALLAFYFMLRHLESRNTSAVSWRQPWLLAMALALGAATAVKWSGLYFVAVFGIYVVLTDLLDRRAAGQKSWALNGLIKQGLISAVIILPTVLFVYLSSWLGWILGNDGYDRNSSPNWLIALWNYHQSAYGFHVGLHTPHSYASNPLTWLLAIRPTSFFYEGAALGENGCEFEAGCSSAITALGNPLIWWASAAAVVYLVVWFVRTRDRTAALIATGIVAGYVPWLFFMGRTVFQFYGIAFLPWMILALLYVWRICIYQPDAQKAARAKVWLLGFVVLACALTAFFLPIWVGTWISYPYWIVHMWLPTWI